MLKILRNPNPVQTEPAQTYQTRTLLYHILQLVLSMPGPQIYKHDGRSTFEGMKWDWT